MEKIRVYVAVCLTHRRNREIAKHICEFLASRNVEVMSPWVAEEDAKQGLNAQQVYCRDIKALSESEAIVAEVSTPSLGVGMELMAAIKNGTPIACLYKKRSKISWMVLGIPGIYNVYFSSYPSGCIDKGLMGTAVWLRSLSLSSITKNINPEKNREVPECYKES